MSAQTWNSQQYDQNARFVSDLGEPVLELLNACAGERVLDLACGDGVLTKKIVEQGCSVVGVDSSLDFVNSALRHDIDAYHMDAYDIQFKNEFDAVFSNAALHWMKDANKVAKNVYRALKHGGRFVAECGGYGCVEIIRVALIDELDSRGFDGARYDPWFFASDTEYREILEKVGFDVQYIALIDRPTPLPGDIAGWLETFSHCFTAPIPVEQRSDFLLSVRDRIKPSLCDQHGNWTADYVRLRFAVEKK
jgi:SAM-dependent methyltransferase